MASMAWTLEKTGLFTGRREVCPRQSNRRLGTIKVASAEEIAREDAEAIGITVNRATEKFKS